MKKISKRGVMYGLAVMVTLTVGYYFASSEKLSVPQYQLDQQQFPHLNIAKTQKIALITDLHSCFYGENQHEIMAILKQQQPDIILLVGDIYDDVLPNQHADILLSQFKDLKAKNQVYYVNGNHELWMDKAEYQAVEEKIKSYGIQILHGTQQRIPDSNIHLFGVEDPVSGRFEQQLRKVGEMANPQHFNILLSHRPELIYAYRQFPFHLVVSGHAHGGQWRVPYLINGVFAPNQGLLPKYAGGEYQFTDGQYRTHFIVSRGLAKESTRYIPRLFNRPEVVMIDLNRS